MPSPRSCENEVYITFMALRRGINQLTNHDNLALMTFCHDKMSITRHAARHPEDKVDI